MARILCVDDDQQILRAYDRILARSGHGTIHAANVGAALHHLDKEEIDLIITDFQMPGIDGLEFLAMLRTERDATPPPVFMVTGHGGIDHPMQAIRAGVD